MRAKDTPRPNTARPRKCRTCSGAFPAGQLINGQCPDCAGLVPLPLRGQGGRFLPGLNPPRGRRDRTAVRPAPLLLLLVVLPLAVLGECDGPMFPDGILPPRASVADPVAGLVLAGLLLVVVAAMAWRRLPTGDLSGQHRPSTGPVPAGAR